MVELLTFVLVCHGMTQIILYGGIFEKIRPSTGLLGDLFSCPMCMGFWVGIFLWGVNVFTGLFSYDLSVVTGFALGCLSSGTCYALHIVLGKIEFLGIDFSGPSQNIFSDKER